MFRTIVRNDLLKGTLKATLRNNLKRTITVEVVKRIHKNSKPVFLKPQSYTPRWNAQLIRNYSSDLPPHIRVTLPALSPTMEAGTIISWTKNEGDKLVEGDLLAEIETDKATMGFETPDEGYLAKILIAGGTKGVPVGKLVCVIVANESDIEAFKNFKDDGDAAPAAPASAPAAPAPAPAAAAPAPAAPIHTPPAPAVAPARQLKAAPGTAPGGRVYASPMAKRLAEQQNIRLEGKGTGLFGSITSSDLDRQASASAPAPDVAPAYVPSGTPGGYRDIPVSAIRSIIATRLHESKSTIPHYYLTVDANAEKVLAFRQKFNKKLEKEGIKLSVNDFVVKAAAQALIKVPEVNAAWLGSAIRQYDNADISIAVSTDKGLMTPIVFEANKKGIITISKDIKALASKARTGELQPQEYLGGTFTISNLGMFGVSHFTAIINPPQCSILAVGTLRDQLVADDSEKGFKKIQYISFTTSSDHRIVDGAMAAVWMQAFKGYFEEPETMIL